MPIVILFMIALPIYMTWRIRDILSIFFFILSGLGVFYLKWMNSFKHVSFDNRYLYATNFKDEKRFNLEDVKKVTQGKFQRMTFEIQIRNGETIRFISKYSLGLIFGDWPENLVKLEKQIKELKGATSNKS